MAKHYTKKKLETLTESQFTKAYNTVLGKNVKRMRNREKGIEEILKAQGKAAPAKAKNGSGVCAQVHAIADTMPEASRADVIAACVAKGINPATASTQYQRWRTAHASN